MVIVFTLFIVIIVNIMLSLTQGLHSSFQTPLSEKTKVHLGCTSLVTVAPCIENTSSPEVNCPPHSSLTPDPAPDGLIPPFHSYKEYSTYPTYPL